MRRRTSPASGVLRGQGLQTIRLNAKRTGEGCGFSPGASGGRRRRADGSSARFGGGIGAVAVEESAAELLRDLGWHGSMHGDAVKP